MNYYDHQIIFTIARRYYNYSVIKLQNIKYFYLLYPNYFIIMLVTNNTV